MRTEGRHLGICALTLALTLGAMAENADAQTKALAQSPQMPTQYLRDLRKQMIAGRPLATRELRALADAAEGLAAFKYGKWLEEQGKPQLLPDAAHYYAIASYSDRDFAARRLMALLVIPTLALTDARRQEALQAMIHQAKTGNADAALALSNMYASGMPFGKNPEATRRWLDIAAKSGRGDAAVKLALLYMMPTDGGVPDTEKARAALELATEQPDPGTKAMAQTLLARLEAMSTPLKLASQRPQGRPMPEGISQ